MKAHAHGLRRDMRDQYVTSWGLPKESKHTEPSFSPISTDSLSLRVAQMPASRDLAIFVPANDDDKTDCFTHCACARGNKPGTIINN